MRFHHLLAFLTLARCQTLPDLFAYKNINYLVGSSDGTQLAWGVNNVFTSHYSSGSWSSPTQVSQYTGDTGYEISNLIFCPNGQLSWTSSPSDNANPLGLASPPLPEFVSCSNKVTGSSQSQSLAVPELDLYSNGPNIMTATGQTLFTVQPSNNQGYLTDFTSFGNTVAFSNNRYDHAFIGLWTVGSSTVTWVSPSFDLDSNPVFSPSGDLIAFYRFFNNMNRWDELYSQGYEIRVASVAAPANSTVVFSNYFPGWPYSYGFGNRPLAWMGESTLVFPDESTGWLHVNAVDLNTLVITDLVPAPGTCEVQDYLPIDETTLLVAHNCDGNLNTISIAQATVDGGWEPLVVGGLHYIAGMADGGWGMAQTVAGPAFIYSTANASTTVAVLTDSGPLDISTTSYNPPLITPTLISFSSLDGLYTIYGQLFMPPSASTTSSPAPGIIFTHGGPMRQMYSAFHYSVDYSQLYAENQYLASQGYVVLSVNYRMGIGYGRHFRVCQGCGEWGAAEYLDVLGGGLWLQKQSFIDPSRIGIYGLSYGGLNCLQALSRNSDLFKVGVANAPVFNWVSESRFDGDLAFDYQPPMPGTALGIGPPADWAGPAWANIVNANIGLAWSSSPAGHIDNFTSPVLVIQGDSDLNVDVQESIGLIRALRRAGKAEVHTLMYPNERHGFSLYANDLSAAAATCNFLAQFL